MEWKRFTQIIGDKDTIDVQHLEYRLFRFNHPALATDSNLLGEYSTTRVAMALDLAGHIAQRGDLG